VTYAQQTHEKEVRNIHIGDGPGVRHLIAVSSRSITM
jgi:hypothetical protein